MAFQQIEVERTGDVLRVLLNRPDKLNALTATMSDELVEVFSDLGGARAVLLSGSGRGFCAGQDLTEFDEAYRSGRRPDIEEHLRRTYHRMIPIMASAPVPVVAAVNGVAAGAGLSLALACDMRVASDQARFTLAFAKIGLVPDSGGTFFLPRVVGYGRAMDLAMANDVLDAEAALGIGLVTRVFPAESFEDDALALAARIASLPTRALVAGRELIRDALTADLETALKREASVQTEMAGTDDHLEGVTAFVEKREARFRGR